MLKKSTLTGIFCLSFLTGIFTGSNFATVATGVIYGLIFFVILFYIFNNQLIYYLIAILGLVFGNLGLNDILYRHNTPAPFATTIELSGIIIQPPLKKNLQQFLIVDNLSAGDQKYTGRIRITTDANQDYSYGQKLVITGQLQPVEDFADNFSYQGYLARDNIFYLSHYPEILTNGPDQRNYFYYIYQLKNYLEKQIHNNHPPPLSDLLSGLLLGTRQALPDQTYQAFKTVGLTHIIVVSGFNLTIFSGLFLKLLRGRLPRLICLIITLFCLIVFTVITGAEASIVRALIMITLMIVGPFLSRQSSGFQSILLAATIMVGFNPLILWYDPGFHLSFLATMGLALFGTPFDNIFSQLRLPAFITGTLAETLAASLLSLPYVAKNFGTLSLIFPVTNIIILPLIPFTMLAGVSNLIISAANLPLITPLIRLSTDILLTFIIGTAEFFSKLPLATIEIQPTGPDLFIIYLLISGFYLLIRPYANQPLLKN